MKHLPTEGVISNSLERGLDALELLAEHGEVRLADLAEELEVSRATAFRILASLQSRGYVEHARAERVYRLGHAVRALAERSDTSSVLRLAAPAMAELRASTGETVNLALLRRGTIVYVAIFDGVHALRMQASVGAVVPAHATAIGKAILAFSDAAVVQGVLDAGLARVSERTITSPELLRQELDRVRESGLAYDSEESRPGLVCVASPVHGPGGQVAGALSVSGWSARMKPDRAGPAVRTAALTISRALGARAVP